ncbi:MAG: TetR/AcrR family transcriptional regulator [Candidatus Aminicenantaceae bacterium]
MNIRTAIEADNSNPKYVQLVEAAHGLFWRYGIKRVSVEEICRAAGVSKMTFYAHFKNKVELALYVLRKVMQTGLEVYRDIMDRDVPFAEKAADFIQMKLDASDDVSREIIEEIMHSPISEIAEYMQQLSRQNVQLLLADLTKAQQNGEIRQDIKPEFLLYFIHHMIEISTEEQLTGMFSSPQDLTRELLSLFFYGILPR